MNIMCFADSYLEERWKHIEINWRTLSMFQANEPRWRLETTLPPTPQPMLWRRSTSTSQCLAWGWRWSIGDGKIFRWLPCCPLLIIYPSLYQSFTKFYQISNHWRLHQMNELDVLLVAIQVDLKTIVFSLSSLGNCTVLYEQWLTTPWQSEVAPCLDPHRVTWEADAKNV